MASNPVSIAELALEFRDKSPGITVRAKGRITSATSGRLEGTLYELMPQVPRIVLDVSQVDYIDAPGLGALANILSHANRIKCDLQIANPRPHLKNLLAIWLHSVFEGHEEFLGMTPD